MGLNADALVTLEQVLARLGEDGTTSLPEEDALEQVINEVSTAVRRRSGREFVPKFPADDANPAEPRSFSYDGSGLLSLEPYEAREITQVALDGTVVDAAVYDLEPANKSLEGTYLWIEALPKRAGRVVVTGRWAIGDVPADVEGIVLTEIARSWRNPEDVESGSMGEFSFTGLGPTSLAKLDAISRVTTG